VVYIRNVLWVVLAEPRYDQNEIKWITKIFYLLENSMTIYNKSFLNSIEEFYLENCKIPHIAINHG
jgi:hypothetical protein